jgi:hypothetical protein
MIKPNKNFKISKQTKRWLATFVDPIKRSEFKRFAIQCQIIGELDAPKKSS